MIFVLRTNELSFFYVRSGIHQSHFAKSKSISWNQRQPGFYLRIWTLFFFFFQKNLLYEDDGIL